MCSRPAIRRGDRPVFCCAGAGLDSEMQNFTPVSLIGAPTDIGAGHRGASMGPEALRVAGIAEALRKRGLDVIDRGNVAGPPRLPRSTTSSPWPTSTGPMSATRSASGPMLAPRMPAPMSVGAPIRLTRRFTMPA